MLSRTADHLLCVVCLEFVDVTFVEERLQQCVHVVGSTVVLGKQVVEGNRPGRYRSRY